MAFSAANGEWPNLQWAEHNGRRNQVGDYDYEEKEDEVGGVGDDGGVGNDGGVDDEEEDIMVMMMMMTSIMISII